MRICISCALLCLMLHLLNKEFIYFRERKTFTAELDFMTTSEGKVKVVCDIY